MFSLAILSTVSVEEQILSCNKEDAHENCCYFVQMASIVHSKVWLANLTTILL